ncbi:tRNA (N6-threonylcarbamoyladenosine(37)-N6)-methyltransferase TrmO [Aidingimonas halophila]|uniref:tRNA-Thr(GGU) m(6)t(6)A37 methyltransferase TsaA n=1 Tax=Aidingimonas halophila TaxID=574349 RepID=A0A1H3EDM7_9GAMM|nr:tRNA (N6-threonylcarbamoyladenosine(37)-N6)-methyltransferase TrmO [Aidingimonas halophila]SDX76730.1 tRNA-Thr(GGU) m(6)t(6)A37 methyltransferase TsaA [Aidingimonas halophila]
MNETDYTLEPIGVVHSPLTSRKEAPRQADEGAPQVWLEIFDSVAEGLDGIEVGDEILVLTLLHHGRRDVLKVHPRSRVESSLVGVFATRSPDRPNPLGLHRVSVLEIDGHRLKVAAMEAIDGTPIVDIKAVLRSIDER